MFIIVFSTASAKYQSLQIPITQAYQIIQSCGNSFETLASRLYFKFGRLCLSDPTKPITRPRRKDSLEDFDSDELCEDHKTEKRSRMSRSREEK